MCLPRLQAARTTSRTRPRPTAPRAGWSWCAPPAGCPTLARRLDCSRRHSRRSSSSNSSGASSSRRLLAPLTAEQNQTQCGFHHNPTTLPGLFPASARAPSRSSASLSFPSSVLSAVTAPARGHVHVSMRNIYLPIFAAAHLQGLFLLQHIYYIFSPPALHCTPPCIVYGVSGGFFPEMMSIGAYMQARRIAWHRRQGTTKRGPGRRPRAHARRPPSGECERRGLQDAAGAAEGGAAGGENVRTLLSRRTASGAPPLECLPSRFGKGGRGVGCLYCVACLMLQISPGSESCVGVWAGRFEEPRVWQERPAI